MKSFGAFLSNSSAVYGLPSWRGILLFFMMGSSVWFAVVQQSALEQWISLLLFFILFVHLLELNQLFSSVDFSLIPFDPPFLNEEVRIEVVLTHLAQIPSEALFLKLDGSRVWVETPPLFPGDRRTVGLSYIPQVSGTQELPVLRVKMRSDSKLFQLWRVIRSEGQICVLPRAIDYQAKADPLVLESILRASDTELSHLDLIRDSRLMPKMDQKLFQKTGLPYLRVHERVGPEALYTLDWKNLDHLEASQREEQFCFWIKTAKSLGSGSAVEFRVDTPFFTTPGTVSRIDWRELKEAFSAWLYEKK